MRKTGWREPSSHLLLRFGTSRSRYLATLGLLFPGGIVLQLGSAYTLGLLLFGVVASLAGWIVAPAPGWRRTVAIGPGLLGVAALLGGAQASGLITLTLAGWLLVRERPPRAFVVLVFPIATSFLLAQLFPQYGWGALVDTIIGAVVVASAWLARYIAAISLSANAAAAQRNSRNRPLK